MQPAVTPLSPNTQSLLLDGSTKYVDVTVFQPSVTITGGDVSVFVWVRPNVVNTTHYFFYMGDATNPEDYLALGISDTNFAFVATRIGSGNVNVIQNATVIAVDTWYQIGFTRQAETINFFVNTSVQGNVNAINSVTITADETVVGGFLNGATSFSGYINHFALWNSVMSLAQVGELYNDGGPKDPSTHTASSGLQIDYWFETTSPILDTAFTINDQANSNDGATVGVIASDFTNTEFPVEV